MEFAFTDDQLAFADALRDLLADVCTPDRVRAAWDRTGWLPDVWEKLAGMGVVGLTAPEAEGGLGMGTLDWVLLLEEAGRAALPAPLLETTVVAIPLLAETGQSEWVARAAAGEAVIAVALDERAAPVAYGAHADALIARDRLLVKGEWRVVDEPRSVDHARPLARIEVDPGAGLALDGADLDAAFDRGALAAAAELCGLGDRLLRTTVEYATQRQQFGAPIGSYQAVKHHLANVLLGLSYARPLVHAAAWHLAERTDEGSTYVSMAKASASDAAVLASKTALQVHGAIGYAWEHDLHLWMKKVWALAAAWGDAPSHRRRVGDAVLH